MYVAGQPAPSRRKKSSAKKKQRNLPAVSPAMVAIAAAVLVAFIGGLYFITHIKKKRLRPFRATKWLEMVCHRSLKKALALC